MTAVQPALAASARAALLRALDDSGGAEICGFLVERRDEQGFRRLRNYGGAGEFSVDPAELDGVLRDLARQDATILAFVHSHRAAPTLSRADRAALRTSRWPWLVVVRTGAGLDGRWYAPGSGGRRPLDAQAG